MTVEQRHNSSLLWMIIGGISIVVLLFLAAQWFFDTQKKSTPPVKGAVSQQPAALSSVSPVTANKTDAVSASEARPAPLIDDSVLKASVPESQALAKEEIARLDDIHTQLKDQQSLLKSQQEDAETLIKLKEDQLKLLENQLAEQGQR